jgi:hypothetical protein
MRHTVASAKGSADGTQSSKQAEGICFRMAENKRPNLLSLDFQRKRLKIKRFGLFCALVVQSLQAPHSKQVNAARA